MVLAPEGRKLLRIEARNSQVPIERKPPWIKTRLRTGPEYTALKNLVRSQGLHTVCEEAGCPNIFECWEDREATFLIGGDACTRRCDFCQIATGKPEPLDTGEPRRVAESVAAMGLRYATVTGVARDDLADGGAWLYGQTCAEIHAAVPGCGVELLIPDFNAEPERLAVVFGARPEVLAHNIETVPRIFRQIRPGVPVRAVAGGARQGQGGRAGDQVQPDPRPRRGGSRDQPGHGRPARGRLRTADGHPVPAAVGPAPSGGPLGAARRVRALARPRHSAWGSPG